MDQFIPARKYVQTHLHASLPGGQPKALQSDL